MAGEATESGLNLEVTGRSRKRNIGKWNIQLCESPGHGSGHDRRHAAGAEIKKAASSV
ncbi:MAG: hypothetical protein R3D69_14720 [Xanthobacteraceae bacterium]